MQNFFSNLNIGDILAKAIDNIKQELSNFRVPNVNNLQQALRAEEEKLNVFSKNIIDNFELLNKQIADDVNQNINNLSINNIPEFYQDIEKEINKILQQTLNDGTINNIIRNLINQQLSQILQVNNNRNMFFQRNN